MVTGVLTSEIHELRGLHGPFPGLCMGSPTAALTCRGQFPVAPDTTFLISKGEFASGHGSCLTSFGGRENNSLTFLRDVAGWPSPQT